MQPREARSRRLRHRRAPRRPRQAETPARAAAQGPGIVERAEERERPGEGSSGSGEDLRPVRGRGSSQACSRPAARAVRRWVYPSTGVSSLRPICARPTIPNGPSLRSSSAQVPVRSSLLSAGRSYGRRARAPTRVNTAGRIRRRGAARAPEGRPGRHRRQGRRSRRLPSGLELVDGDGAHRARASGVEGDLVVGLTHDAASALPPPVELDQMWRELAVQVPKPLQRERSISMPKVAHAGSPPLSVV